MDVRAKRDLEWLNIFLQSFYIYSIHNLSIYHSTGPSCLGRLDTVSGKAYKKCPLSCPTLLSDVSKTIT
jgi:hypothetical protein